VFLPHNLFRFPSSIACLVVRPEHLKHTKWSCFVESAPFYLGFSLVLPYKPSFLSIAEVQTRWLGSDLVCTSGDWSHGRCHEYLAKLEVRPNDRWRYQLFCKISKGPMNLGVSFPLWPNWTLPLRGDTFRNTWSPMLNSKDFLRLSTKLFCRL